MIVPRRIQIESVYGCNARCNMCPVNLPPKRPKQIMDNSMYRSIIDDLIPYRDQIEMVDLFGLGEPLLDHHLSEKIAYTKEKGFGSLAISTNADLLSTHIAKELLMSGIDTIIVSIDGMNKETHEKIRKNTVFERVMSNTEAAIRLRNRGSYRTKFVLRFLRQEENRSQWDWFLQFWSKRISLEAGDKIIGYDAHNWGGKVSNYPRAPQCSSDHAPCHHVFDRLIVLSDGTVPLCCIDMYDGANGFGNIRDGSPMEIFNNEKAAWARRLHKLGKRKEMKICEGCTILDSEACQNVEYGQRVRGAA